ncbi:hypothetical protein [Mesorhizobium sp. NZP2234]|uniref:hypothetical protein n=1 Tax=Mesorhizobium sp. NZP2234 TaxID=2483402 RepID=UPI00155663DE|nr:hypothetical protein [Mesorhizobium sp. NZP2234]
MTVAVADVEDRMLENGRWAVMRLEACVRVMAIDDRDAAGRAELSAFAGQVTSAPLRINETLPPRAV